MSSVAFRRIPLYANRIANVRYYSGELGSSTPPSGTAEALNKREKAQEDIYVRQHEQEKLKALREELAKQRQEIDELKKAIKQ